MAIYKAVEQGSGIFEKKLITLGVTSLNGEELKFSKADRTDLLSYNANLFSSFNLPITTTQKNKFTGSGQFANSAFQHLNQDKVIVVEIVKNSYGEEIDGKTFSIKVPLKTGSVYSTITCYSSFFSNSLISEIGEQLYSDPNQESAEFGQNYAITELPGQNGLPTPKSGYSSNVAFLFSDDIRKPRGNNSYTWSQDSKYFIGQYSVPPNLENFKWPANMSNSDGTGVDVPVGIVYLDKGFAVLTHPAIVNNFAHDQGINEDGSDYSGDAKFNNIHFSGATLANVSFNSFNTEFIQRVSCFALPNEFYTSSNPTFVEAYGLTNTGNNPVAFTEVALYNSKYELIGIAKTSEPILKTKADIVTFDVQIKL